MSTRDKSDFGSGKILPDELPDGAASGSDGEDDAVHPDRAGATGPDIAAAEAADRAAHDHAEGVAAVEHGAHFRPDEPDAVPDEPLDPPRRPRHVRPADAE